MKRIAAAVFLFFLTASPGFAALVNPDFEDGLNGWDTFKSDSRTTVSTLLYDVDGDGTSSSASWFFYVGSGTAGISQVVETLAGELTLSLDFAIDYSGSSGWSDTVNLLVDDSVIATASPGYFRNGEERRFVLSGSLNVDAGFHELKLAVINAASPKYFYYLSDDWQMSITAVPLPSAAWLLAGGMLGIVGIRKQRF